MSNQLPFTELWDHQEFHLPDEEQVKICSSARKFGEWCDPLINEAVRQKDPIALNQAKIHLVDRYFNWRGSVTKSHRELVRDENHICIWHIFERAYQQIRAAELVLTPPQLFVPEPAQSSRLPTVIKEPTGIYLGEIIGGDE